MENIDVKIVVGLIAVFVSFVGLIISKEQKISDFRQKWIDEIRTDIAELMGCLSTYEIKWAITDSKENEDTFVKFITDNVETMSNIQLLRHRISLRLNPVKDKKLVKTLDNIETMMMSPNEMAESGMFKNLTDTLNTQSHDMLKVEWSRVKDGEFIYKATKFTFGFVILIIIHGSILTYCSTVVNRSVVYA